MSNVQLAKDIYAAFGRGDIPTVLAAFHPDAGEYVVVEGRYTGTYKPSGRKLDSQLCHVLRFQGGKPVSFQQYLDTAQLQRVMPTA